VRSSRKVAALVAVTILSVAACTDSAHERARAKRVAQETIRGSVTEFANKWSANEGWYAELNKLRGDLGSIYSVDLERLWIASSPILFVGKLEDVATISDAEYRLVAAEDFLPYFRAARFRLELACPRQIVDPIVSRIRSAPLAPLDGVAIVANVFQMSAKHPESESVEALPTFTGHGQCVDLFYVVDRSAWFSRP